MTGVRVLLAEDEGLVAEDLQGKLTRMGHSVVAVAASGEEAVAAAAQVCPDLVLMDIRLVGPLDGIEAAGQIGARMDAVIIYLTAYSDDRILQRARATGPFGYLIKPVQLRKLQATIEMALQRRELERRLQASERHWATMLASIGDAVLAADLEGRITFLNPVAERLTGWKQQDAVGLPLDQVFRIIDGRSRAARENPARRVLSAEQILELAEDSVLVARDGSETPVVDRVSPINDDSGRIAGCVLVFRDDSARRQAREALRESEARIHQAQKLESLGVLASGIAHDFNNLLTGVLGYADLALLNLPLNAPARTYVEKAVEQSWRLVDLTCQMQACAGKGRFNFQPVHLSHLVRDLAGAFQISLVKEASLVYDLADDLPLVEADVTGLGQAIVNLIVNASEALGSHGGTITVRSGTRHCDRAWLQCCQPDDALLEGTYVFVEVSDTGCGMTPATQARIWEPFFTTKFTGRGLGLAVVQGIVRAHGGKFHVVSEPGRGSTFTVLFPVSGQ